MIDTADIRVGKAVYYQQAHMAYAQFGIITGAVLSRRSPELSLVQILFIRDKASLRCYPRDLFWPINMRTEERLKWHSEP